MVIGATIVTGSKDFEGCANSIPSAIVFFAFGTFCFIIGTCLPQVLGYEPQEAEIRNLKRQIAMLESRLAQQDANSFTTRGEAGDRRFYDTTEEEDARKMKRTLQSHKGLKTALEKANAQREYIQGEWRNAMTELAVVKEEMRGARIYMSMEDEYSGAEVVKHVERLNAAITQAAANMVERFDVEMMVRDGSTLENSRAEDIIGTYLMTLLRTSTRKQALLELAFQAAMSLYVQKMASSWCFRGLEDEGLLQSSYMSMRQDKLQAIFGRWRQLTRTHLRSSKSAIERQLVPNLAEELADIVVAAGHRENSSSIRQVIMTSCRDALNEIVDLAKELNCMIGEGVTSFDMSATVVKPNTLYDPARMVEADGSNTGGVRERIVCTTDLGLVGTRKTLDSTDTSVMLRAKVILPSMLAGIEDT